MPSWFDKVFKSGAPGAKGRGGLSAGSGEEDGSPYSMLNPILEDEDFEEEEARPKLALPRRVIEPVIKVDPKDLGSGAGDIRIKASVTRENRNCCVFMVDRLVLEGYSTWHMMTPDPDEAPLPAAIFGVNGVDSVQIHGMNVTVTRSPESTRSWKEIGADIGALIRDFLKNGKAVVTQRFLDSIPPEPVLREKIEYVIETEINPGIAGHSGAISLEKIEGNTLYIKMMGGCQGCAASTITLKQGIHGAFRAVAPQVGAILDITDHSAGKNPFYRELPAGMTRDA